MLKLGMKKQSGPRYRGACLFFSGLKRKKTKKKQVKLICKWFHTSRSVLYALTTKLIRFLSYLKTDKIHIILGPEGHASLACAKAGSRKSS